MQRHARKTQDCPLPPRLCALLAQLRARAGVEGPYELDVDRVRDVEAVLGGELPAPWLGILAAKVAALNEELGFDLAEAAAHTKEAHRFPVQKDFVALGRRGRPTFFGFLRGREADRMVTYDSDRKSLTPQSIEEWLAATFELETVEDPGAEAFSVRLIRHVLPTDDGKKRVLHAKWGEGLVLAEHGEGPTRKVKAEFPGLGLKVVQARFLEFIE